MSNAFCPSCGYQARVADRFCRACGDALTDNARSAGPIAEAEALCERGRLDEAIATVQRAIGLAETPDLHVALATLYLRRGGSADARRALDRAIALDARCAIAHAYLGGMLMQSGHIDEAQARLDLARDLAPNDLIVLMKRSEFWVRLGVLENAKDELRRGLRNGAGSPQTRHMAEVMFLAIEKRARNSFARQTIALPSPNWIGRVFKRSSSTPSAPAEVEA